jgi:ribonuclease-3
MTKIKSLFKNKKLLTLALTHKSWVNEHPGKRESNERLEFLGDAILEFLVSQKLYQEFPDKEEGYLTALRANLVNTVNLANIADKIALGKGLYLSKGEEEGGGRKNPSILANTVESVIGALFIDGGIKAAESFVKKYLLSELEEKTKKPLKDPKSRLQEIVQAKGYSAPKYEVVDEEGPDHNKKFTIAVIVEGETKGTGFGKNKSLAAQEAAKDALNKFV